MFGLFDCSAACTEIGELKGGYGTTGESIVITVPVSDLGLSGDQQIDALEVFSARGTYLTGAVQLLDSLDF